MANTEEKNKRTMAAGKQTININGELYRSKIEIDFDLPMEVNINPYPFGEIEINGVEFEKVVCEKGQ